MSEKQLPKMIEKYNPNDEGSISIAETAALGEDVLAVIGNFEDNNTKKLLAKYVKYFKLCNDDYSYENSTIFDNLSTTLEQKIIDFDDITLKLQLLAKSTPTNVHEVDFAHSSKNIEEVA